MNEMRFAYKLGSISENKPPQTYISSHNPIKPGGWFNHTRPEKQRVENDKEEDVENKEEEKVEDEKEEIVENKEEENVEDEKEVKVENKEEENIENEENRVENEEENFENEKYPKNN